jgi:choline-sulfatase
MGLRREEPISAVAVAVLAGLPYDTLDGAIRLTLPRYRGRRALLAVAGLLLGAGLLLSGCGMRRTGAGANVLVVTIDTLRADHLGCYGYRRPTSPRIDALAKEGTLFETAYCPMPTTGPSHASLFTSLYPRRHGMLKNGWKLAEDLPTLAESLKQHGYRTGAVVSSFVLDPCFGMARGFDDYDSSFEAERATMGREIMWEGEAVNGGFDQRADATTLKAARWLEERQDERFFLWVHYFDPHSPYEPPEPHARDYLAEVQAPGLQETVARYDGEIRFVDEELGKLLDRLDSLGLRSRTLVVLTADHGEGLGQHNWMHHGLHLYEEAVRIPLAFRLPGVVAAGRRVEALAEMIDVAPTILDLVDLPREPRFGGQSLVPALLGESTSERLAFLERRRYELEGEEAEAVKGDKFGVRYRSYKYHWAPDEGTEQLFDLSADPTELHNLAARLPSLAASLQERIRSWRREEEAGRALPGQTVSPEIEKRLEALGYVR